MGKAKKDKPEADAPARSKWFWAHVVGVVVFIGSLTTLAITSRQYVETRTTPSVEPTFVFTNAPGWIDPKLTDRMLKTLRAGSNRSSLDSRLLEQTAWALRSEPWIKEVRQVRRAFGHGPGDVVEIDAVFRIPAVLVEFGGAYWLVDSEGVQLPERFETDQLRLISLDGAGNIRFRIVTGVRTPPFKPGEPWPGSEVRDAIDLARLLQGRDFAADIAVIDVSNAEGRIDSAAAFITMFTRQMTEVRWGRPVREDKSFIEVSPELKVRAMETIHREFGRVDATSAWVDVRFDRPTVAPQRLAKQ
jgi:hypothetical protein